MNRKTQIVNLTLKHKAVIYCAIVMILGVGVCIVSLPLGLALEIVSLVMVSGSLFDMAAAIKSSEAYYAKMDAGEGRFDITKGVTLPMAAIGTDGKITWWNEAFAKICPHIVMHEGITDVFDTLTVDILLSMKKETRKLIYEDRTYEMKCVQFKAQNASDSAFVITLRDMTDFEKAKEEADNSRTVIAQILIDNYDEVFGDVGDDVSYQTEKAIDAIIFEWAKELGGSAKHFDKERYFCVFNAKMLSEMKKRRFDVLDKVKEIETGISIQPTLSMGIGVDGADIYEVDMFAKAALDMALGRGGDQAVIKDAENFSYYGGKNRETEKRARVKARVKAQALVRLIEQSENVLVMGHTYADTDAFGAATALAVAAMARGKQAKVIMESYDSTVRATLKNFEKNKTHFGLFITRQQARELLNDKTLVIVCDTHRRSLTAAPEIVDDAKTIVLIDHHRRSEEFITNTDLLYHEPSASSSCEMVTEMLQYMGRSGIDAEIAEAMYAGILVDTNNFVFKTAARTFEAAAYLKRLGADTIRVQSIFKESMTSYTERAQIVSDAQMYRENMAISKVYSNTVSSEIIAKAANDLLEIEGVSASFVVAKTQGATTRISGRSLGSVNIQMIMEKLGGGGHMLQGAAQLEDVYVDEAETRLKAAIDSYMQNR
ncbi:MAG: DHH family phosphoesterase [Clostridia bacterium]|nr:DHH family phosphoesterase [Clostridia bacterium]